MALSRSFTTCMVHVYFYHTVQPLAPSYLKQGHLMDVIEPVYKDPGINIHLKNSQSTQVIKIRHKHFKGIQLLDLAPCKIPQLQLEEDIKACVIRGVQ